MTSRRFVLPDDLSEDDALQVAWFIGKHITRSETTGMSVSPGLRELGRAVSQRAMQGQAGPDVGRQPQRQKAEPMDPLLLTYGQAADLLGCSLSTVKRRVAVGALVPVRDHGCTRLRRTDIDHYINQKRGVA